MKIAVAKEIDPSEPRVAASPDTVKKFKALGAEVVVEPGAGVKSGLLDSDFTAAGATVSADAVKDADIVRTVVATTAHSYLLFFTNLGRVYRRRALQIPERDRSVGFIHHKHIGGSRHIPVGVARIFNFKNKRKFRGQVRLTPTRKRNGAAFWCAQAADAKHCDKVAGLRARLLQRVD